MSHLIDVTKLNAAETTELMAECARHLDDMRRQAMQQAELLGLTCTMPEGKRRKPRKSEDANGAGDERPAAAMSE